MKPLYEAYRPTTWSDVVGQDKIVAKLRALMRRGLGGRAFWISGQSGTGKTTIGRLIAAEVASPVSMDPILLRLALPVGHLVVLLVLYQRLRGSVLFPTVAVHLFLIVFCLLVTAFDPERMAINRLTLIPIFATNLVLMVVTHGLLTLLFCRNRLELLAAVILAAIGGGILALGTMVIALVSMLNAGPLFFFQLYLVSAFGIFGLYFCASSIVLSLFARD